MGIFGAGDSGEAIHADRTRHGSRGFTSKVVAMEVKDKVCRNENCKKRFKPFSSLQKFCSMSCTKEAEKVKQNARESKKKARLEVDKKTVFELAKITFNAFIRERDSREPCISCGAPYFVFKQAGHYFSGGGHANVLFDEDNVHGQCVKCNIEKAGNTVEYGVRLERKIGKARFEVLRANAYEPKRWEVDELQSIIREYKQKKKGLHYTI